MSAEFSIELENHLLKCRCCMKYFEMDDAQIRITPIVVCRFFELTNLNVRTLQLKTAIISRNCISIVCFSAQAVGELFASHLRSV